MSKFFRYNYNFKNFGVIISLIKIIGIEPKNFKIHVFSAFKLPRLAMPFLGTILKNKGYKDKIFLEERAPINENVIKEADGNYDFYHYSHSK